MENDVVYFVYLTKNKINGRMYIGQHRCKREDVFTDGYLGSGIAIRLAIKKYGRENFERVILEYANSPEELNELEAKYANEAILQNSNFYNLKTGGKQYTIYSEEVRRKMSASRKGMIFTDEHRKHISESKKRENLSEETRKRISDAKKGNKNRLGKHFSEESRKKMHDSHIGKGNAWLGQHHTEEAKKKMSIKKKALFENKQNHPWFGKKQSLEHREKISNSLKGNIPWNKGKKMSDEYRQKLSEAHKGKKRSEESLKKLSASLKGHPVSQETKEKIRKSLIGHKVSEETRLKIVEAHKKRKALNNIQDR